MRTTTFHRVASYTLEECEYEGKSLPLAWVYEPGDLENPKRRIFVGMDAETRVRTYIDENLPGFLRDLGEPWASMV